MSVAMLAVSVEALFIDRHRSVQTYLYYQTRSLFASNRLQSDSLLFRFADEVPVNDKVCHTVIANEVGSIRSCRPRVIDDGLANLPA